MRRLAIGLGILAILTALGGDAEAWVRGGAAMPAASCPANLVLQFNSSCHSIATLMMGI